MTTKNTHMEHADHPHTPGTLYDCPLCESECFCLMGEWDGEGFELDRMRCVRCAIADEDSSVDGFTDPTWGEPPF